MDTKQADEKWNNLWEQCRSITGEDSAVSEIDILNTMQQYGLTDPKLAYDKLKGLNVNLPEQHTTFDLEEPKNQTPITKENLGAMIAKKLGAQVTLYPEGRGYKINPYKNDLAPTNERPTAWEEIQKEEEAQREESRSKGMWYDKEDTPQRKLGAEIRRSLEASLANREQEQQQEQTGFTVPPFNPGKIDV